MKLRVDLAVSGKENVLNNPDLTPFFGPLKRMLSLARGINLRQGVGDGMLRN